MCISGLGSGDILYWILLLVSVETSAGHTVEVFGNSVDRKQALEMELSFLTHCTSLAVPTLFHSVAASLRFLSSRRHSGGSRASAQGELFSPQKK